MATNVVVFVLGGPGSGKGTHCVRLKNKYGWVHLSTGDLFRAEVDRGTEQGKLLAEIMREGDMAPPEITLGLLEAAMTESPSKKFLIDGFPRAMDQVHGYQEWFGRQGHAVLFFACTEEVMTERIMTRGQGRVDDNHETIQKRMAKFREVSMPVIEWYRGHTDILKTIDANRSIEEVGADVDAYISSLEAKLGITSAAPAAFAAARAPTVTAPEDDLITLDNSAPSQAPVFLDLNGDTDAPMSLGDPPSDFPSTEPSSSDATSVEAPNAAAAAAPATVDPFSASEEAESPPDSTPEPPTPPVATPQSLSQPAEDVTVPELRPVVISGPSGVGKGTLVVRLMSRHVAHFGFTVSHTTRQPRPGEQDGKDYHFVTREEMQKAVADGKFLEHAEVHGNLYGTSIAAVRAVKAEGKTAILEIDVQGARQVRDGPHGDSALFIFVMPPSMEELEHRLRGRGTEAEEKIQRRLANARKELEAADEPGFVSHFIVNKDLETAVGELEAAVAAHLPELNMKPAAVAPLPLSAAGGGMPGATGVPKGAAGDPGGDECACQGTSSQSKAAGANVVQEASDTAQVAVVKQYLRDTVAPYVEAAMLALVKARPTEDQLQFVIDHLVDAKAQRREA